MLTAGIFANATEIALKQKCSISTGEKTATLPAQLSMVKQLPSIYTKGEEGKPSNYYLIFASREDASYSRDNGVEIKDGYALFVDLYAPSSFPIDLPVGTYTLSEDNLNMTYDPYYSYMTYYNAEGKGAEEWLVEDVVSVTKDSDGAFTITVKVRNNSSSSTVTFKGSLAISDSATPSSAFTQIRENLDLNLTAGGYGIYDGNLYNSNTGSMYINLFEKAYEEESGKMLENGYALALQVFGKLFTDSKSSTLEPGTYTVATNFARGTWYPGREIEYMGMTGLMGSYVRCLNPDKYSDKYAYSYLSSGTIVIEDAGNQEFKITVDAVTTLGHTVKATFQGKVPTFDYSDGKGPSALSTLEDDVDLDLAKIKQAHAWNNGIKNGHQTFLVDIGSPSGRDKELDNGGDIMRIEFVVPSGERYLLPGTYTVMDEKWESCYAPYLLGKGYFVATGAGGSDLSGTRYMHFIEDRFYILGHYAPADRGTVGVTKNADGTYKFDIALMCDANFHIDGSWSGPVELMYNPEEITGIDDITSDSEGVGIEFVDINTLRVTGVANLESAKLYDTKGTSMPCIMNGDCLDISVLPYGVYILNINNKTVKFIKK